MGEVSRFLKKCPNDTEFINKLFVTSFLAYHQLTLTNDSFLCRYIFTSDAFNDYVDGFQQAMFKEGRCFSFEDYVELFEYVISPSDKIVSGAVYTPKHIREYIENYCLSSFDGNLDDCKIVDLSCGCGGFLIDMASKLKQVTGKSFQQIFSDNIYGVDIQEYSVDRTKIMLSLLAKSFGEDADFEFNIWQGDTLSVNFADIVSDYKGFDIIVGNPPYVCSRNLLPDTKKLMKRWSVCSTGHPDLYIPFFQIAFENLSTNGIMGYITMNSFLKSINGRAVRSYMQEKKRQISIIDFRGQQVFRSKSTYTCLFFAKNCPSNTLRYTIKDSNKLVEPSTYNSFVYTDLESNKGWDLNNTINVNYLEGIGTPICKYSQSRHGIATLCNSVYIFKPIYETTRYYVICKDGMEYQIEKDICRDIVNPNKLNSDVTFDSIIEKVIFPYYKSSEGKMVAIPEDSMQKRYPKTYKYLMAYRNKLAARDKGAGSKYPIWYQYGRTQSLTMPPVKLFFPKIANHAPHCVLINDPDLLLYNGMAFVSDDMEKLKILQKVFESSLFWDYLVSNSKPYASGYYSLNGVYMKNFGICNFSKEDKAYMLKESDREILDAFIRECYNR